MAHGGGDLTGVGHRWDVDGAHDDLGVRDPDAHVAPEALVLGPQRAQRRAESVAVGDLTVAYDAQCEVGAGGAAQPNDAVELDLGGDHTTGLDVESDDGACLRARGEGEGHRESRRSSAQGPGRFRPNDLLRHTSSQPPGCALQNRAR